MNPNIDTGPISTFLQWLSQTISDWATNAQTIGSAVQQGTFSAGDAKTDLMQCSDTLAEGAADAVMVLLDVLSGTPPPAPSPQTSEFFTTTINVGLARSLSMAQALFEPLSGAFITAVTFLPTSLLAQQSTFQFVADSGGAPGGVYVGKVQVTPMPAAVGLAAGPSEIVDVHIQIP
jgi:hypothetical protein